MAKLANNKAQKQGRSKLRRFAWRYLSV